MCEQTEAIVRLTIPDHLRERVRGAGIDDAAFAFAARSDLRVDGTPEEVWLVVAADRALVIRPEGAAEAEPTVFMFENISAVRLHQTVGSAFLQFSVDGVQIDVLRLSNGLRDIFARVTLQIERLLKGQGVDREGLASPEDLKCPLCRTPLPEGAAECPRCSAGYGVFLRTLALMRPYTRYILILLGLLIIRVGLNLVPPYLVRVLVDSVLQPRANLEWLPRFVLALLGLGLLTCTASIVIGRVSAGVAAKIGRDLREVLQAKLMGLDLEYYHLHSVGGLMSRVLWDVEYFQSFVNQLAEGLLLNVLTIAGIGVMLFYLNWKLALLVLLPIPVVVVSTALFWRHVYPLYYPVWESQSRMAQLLSGMLSGIRTVKAFGQEEREKKRFSESAKYMEDARFLLGSSVATFYPIMGFAFGFGGLIIWYYGGGFVLDGALTLGTLMAFFGYLGMFYGPVHALSFFSNWTSGFVSAGQRVFEILDGEATIRSRPDAEPVPAFNGAIEFRDVTFGYKRHTPTLKNVSFHIEPGQLIGVVGRSGSGKTTLANLICRFYDVQQGQVLIDGMDVRDLPKEDVRDHVALVLQEPFLFRASIMENIAYGCPDADPMTVVAAAKAANAHDFICGLPAAYDTRLGECGAGLSGGERQRVTIARALIRRPRVLILDEATSSVDTESEMGIQRALAQLRKHCTTVVIAHRLSTLKDADSILVLDEGRAVESGTHEELIARDGIYSRLVRIQTRLAHMEGAVA